MNQVASGAGTLIWRPLRDFALIVKAEFVRDIIYMRRYPLEPLSFLFFMYLILMAFLFGLSQLLTQKSSAVLNQEVMILGYCLMQFVMATQMGWSGQIQNESQTGTLEQLSISGHTLGGVLLARGIAQFPRQALSFFLLLGAYHMTIPEAKLTLANWQDILFVLFVSMIGIFGVAFVFAGLTLLFKRVGFFFQIINFAFLGLFWQNRATLGDVAGFIYDTFPLTVGMSNLQRILIEGGAPATATPQGLVYLGVVSAVSMIVGFLLFYKMEQRARELALLSQY